MLGGSGVHDVPAVVFEEAAGMPDAEVAFRQGLRAFGLGAEGVYPGVQLHSAFVAGADHTITASEERGLHIRASLR